MTSRLVGCETCGDNPEEHVNGNGQCTGCESCQEYVGPDLSAVAHGAALGLPTSERPCPACGEPGVQQLADRPTSGQAATAPYGCPHCGHEFAA